MFIEMHVRTVLEAHTNKKQLTSRHSPTHACMLIAFIIVPGGGGSEPEAEVATLSQMSSPFTWDMAAVYPHKAMSTLKMPPRPFEPKQLAIITDPDTTSGEHDWIQEPPVTSSAPASGKDVGYTSCVYI